LQILSGAERENESLTGPPVALLILSEPFEIIS
jgi:hypothetical protein